MVTLSEFFSNLFNPGPQLTIFRPRFERASPVPPPPPPIDNRGEIFFFQNQLSQARAFLADTFKKPVIRTRCGNGPCRGPNTIGSFGAKGTISTIDPFTGQRIAVGQSFRGTARGAAIFGGRGQLALNAQRVQQGNILQANTLAFIADISSRIGLLRSELWFEQAH